MPGHTPAPGWQMQAWLKPNPFLVILYEWRSKNFSVISKTDYVKIHLQEEIMKSQVLHRLSSTMTASDKDAEETRIVLVTPLRDLKAYTLALGNCITTMAKVFKT